jgi:AbrB family looped-hinge helix DNA binding protein
MAKNLETTTKLGEGGRLVIPAPYRKALGVGPGDTLVLRLEDGELRVTSRAQAVRRAQSYVRRYVPEGVSVVDDLIQQRREEASRE